MNASNYEALKIILQVTVTFFLGFATGYLIANRLRGEPTGYKIEGNVFRGPSQFTAQRYGPGRLEDLPPAYRPYRRSELVEFVGKRFKTKAGVFMLLGVYSTQEVPDVQINKQIIDWSLAECVVTSAGIVSPAQLACTGTWFTDKTPCAMYLGPDPSSN